jgi:hypothetical protein
MWLRRRANQQGLASLFVGEQVGAAILVNDFETLGQTRNGSIPQWRDVLLGEMSFGAQWPAAVARRGSRERVRAAASGSIWRLLAGRAAREPTG